MSWKFGDLESVLAEFEGAQFGDKRLNRRLEQIIEALQSQPSKGFPEALGTDVAAEGLYRFLANERVTLLRILEPHFQQTAERVLREKDALIIHDTTTFCFLGEAKRDGLCKITRDKQGFYGHFAFAVSGGSSNQPLGALGLEVFTRTRDKGRRPTRDILDDPSRESLRWQKLVTEVANRLAGAADVIHVMDRQADGFELFDLMHKGEHRFVIRVHHDRKLAKTEQCEKLFSKLDQSEYVCEREVPLSPRKLSRLLQNSKRRTGRNYRLATLAFRATTVEVDCPPDLRRRCLRSLNLNVVHVRELNVPQGLEPVDWKLVTTEPIESAEQILKVVDIYRKRWLIEEYFKALKTGCAYEKRQLESMTTLLNALGLLVPIAYRLLLLRSMSREDETASASLVLSESQIILLRARSRKPLPTPLTAHAALIAIAQLGGHLKSNGPPGWIVLWRGYQKLLSLEEGWLLCAAASDQS